MPEQHRPSLRPAGWIRRAVGNVSGSVVLLLVAVLVVVVVVVVVVVFAAQTAALVLVGALLVGFVGSLFVLGVRMVVDALRRVRSGRWTDGTVRSLVSSGPADEGQTRYVWEVEFRDSSGATHRTRFVSFDFSRPSVTEGTALRVRYLETDSGNAVAIAPGAGARVGHWVTSGVLLMLWGLFVASVPVGLAVVGIRWLVSRS